MEINHNGVTRMVILTKRYAFKIPVPYDYRRCLQGLLSNMQEVRFSKAKWPELCPVLFHLPLGLLVVMPRVRVMTEEEFDKFDFAGFVHQYDYYVPSESKPDSFGWLDGKIVTIDYGN